MTARIIRRGLGRHNWRLEAWRVVLAIIALLAAWLILASVAAAPPPAARSLPRGAQPISVPPVPGFVKGLDPSKFLESLLPNGNGNQDHTERLARIEISWDEEVRLGAQVWEDLKQRLAAQKVAIVQRGREVQYLERLVAAIQPQMQQAQRYSRLEVAVASVEVPNAYALPAGRIIVTRGMLEKAGCEAALVCVLGHELAHLDRGHLLRRMKQWKLAQDQLAKPLAEPSFDRMFDQLSVMQQLFRQPFGPEEELEADRDGVTWAYHLGYDPQTVQQVYVAMEQAGLGAPAFLPAFLRSHPLTTDRAEKLRAAYATLQNAEPKARPYLGRENLRRRIARSQQEFAE